MHPYYLLTCFNFYKTERVRDSFTPVIKFLLQQLGYENSFLIMLNFELKKIFLFIHREDSTTLKPTATRYTSLLDPMTSYISRG